METDSIPALLAFAAGVLSFLSPCQLAVVPGFVGYLSGAAAGGSASRARTVSHALAFVLGFSVVLIALGASVGLVGYLIYDYLPVLRRVGGVVLIVFGLHVLGILVVPFLDREAKLGVDPAARRGYSAAFLLGLVFGFGWTPCVGPTLAAILLLASTTQTVGQGALLLTLYSVGLGLPYLATALALGTASRVLRRVNRRGNLVSVASGALLIVMGVLLFTGRLTWLASAFGGATPLGL